MATIVRISEVLVYKHTTQKLGNKKLVYCAISHNLHYLAKDLNTGISSFYSNAILLLCWNTFLIVVCLELTTLHFY